ncbi:MAG: hypothetical protein LCI00_32015 [Chloroflexi bacterium]|nr:hypothetical protein [Chloroflexota bacterium]MCC6894263.1 hypothetical protein [Anaerolineae bacterium]
MPTFQSDPKLEQMIDRLLADHPIAKRAKMFGYRAYKVNGKLAVGLFDNGIMMKVGARRVRELTGETGIQPFEPSEGRAWKEWILVTSDFDSRKSLCDEAIEYVLEETSYERTSS